MNQKAQCTLVIRSQTWTFFFFFVDSFSTLKTTPSIWESHSDYLTLASSARAFYPLRHPVASLNHPQGANLLQSPNYKGDCHRCARDLPRRAHPVLIRQKDLPQHWFQLRLGGLYWWIILVELQWFGWMMINSSSSLDSLFMGGKCSCARKNSKDLFLDS